MRQSVRCAGTAARNSRRRACAPGCKSPDGSENQTSAPCAHAPRPANQRATATHWRRPCAAAAHCPGNRPVASSPAPYRLATAPLRATRPAAHGCRPDSTASNRASPSRWPRPRQKLPAAQARAEPGLRRATAVATLQPAKPVQANRTSVRSHAARPPLPGLQQTTIPAHVFPRSSPTRGRRALRESRGCPPPEHPGR
ncbi:hypothetical protein D3C84_702170 [compost metagenome]